MQKILSAVVVVVVLVSVPCRAGATAHVLQVDKTKLTAAAIGTAGAVIAACKIGQVGSAGAIVTKTVDLVIGPAKFKIIARVLGFAGALIASQYLVPWMQEHGWSLNPSTGAISKPDPAAPAYVVAPGAVGAGQLHFAAPGGTFNAVMYPSYEAARTASVGCAVRDTWYANGGYWGQYGGWTANFGFGFIYPSCGNIVNGQAYAAMYPNVAGYVVPNTNPSTLAVSTNEFEDALYADTNSSAPSTNALGLARDAVSAAADEVNHVNSLWPAATNLPVSMLPGQYGDVQNALDQSVSSAQQAALDGQASSDPDMNADNGVQKVWIEGADGTLKVAFDGVQHVVVDVLPADAAAKHVVVDNFPNTNTSVTVEGQITQDQVKTAVDDAEKNQEARDQAGYVDGANITPEATPAAPDKKSLSTVLDWFFSTVNDLPVISALTHTFIVLEGASPVVSFQLGGLLEGEYAFDFSAYEVWVSLLGQLIYSIVGIRAIIMLFSS